MRFEFDAEGYVKTILYGCTTGSCVEYAGRVPTEPEAYADMDDWADRAKTQAYYINDEGHLAYDANRAEALCPEDEVVFDKYTPEQIKSMGIFDAIYPVGSLYISVNDVSPAVLFGGTWEPIKDRFLIGASDNYQAEVAGGSTRHQHTSPNGYNADNKLMGMSFAHGTNRTSGSGEYAALSQAVTTGSGAFSWVLPKTDNVSHMPPYLPVYMWKRVEDPIPDDYQGFVDKDGNTFLDADANEFMVKVAR